MCIVCGGPRPPKRKYCSDRCMYARPSKPYESWALRRQRSESKAETRTCLCGKSFGYVKKLREKYCSTGCAAIYAERRHPTKCEWRCEIPWIKCSECGSTFRRRLKATYCSDECRKAKGRRLFHEGFVPKVGPPVEHRCPMCNQQFVTRRYSARRRFCSTKCGDRWQRIQPAAIAKNRLKRAEREAFIAAGEQFASWEIFVRDNWMCHICGKKVMRRKKHPHPLSPTLDHLVPVNGSEHGQHTRLNVRTAHFICNAKRREVGPAQLILFGEAA